ncbi:hypothetical protein DEO72_LG3g2047 [Vigna unguiculata]|uniref:Uncharacterized protein n=1 Tax=Vigna unguiculata TaxID=3917 RepID=A0A4D6LFY3_VIGUN|nr:hypothetical protein DEO72_LG3g2047 [Vigna unguiculata]
MPKTSNICTTGVVLGRSVAFATWKRCSRSPEGCMALGGVRGMPGGLEPSSA